jgi:calcium-independent phospholipase A2-gamma
MERCQADNPRITAIMLGRLQMSADECIEAYLHLLKFAFQKKKSRLVSIPRFLSLQEQYDSHLLETAIKEICLSRGEDEDAFLYEPEKESKV